MSGNTAQSKINPIDLDASLDDIEDLPAFASLPTGAYHVVTEKGFVRKIVNDHPSEEFAMTVKEVIELLEEHLEEGESLPKAGDVATMLFQLDNPIGAGLYKEVAKVVRDATGAKTPREIAEASKGMEFLAVIKRRKGKKGTENEDRNFMNLVKISVME